MSGCREQPSRLSTTSWRGCTGRSSATPTTHTAEETHVEVELGGGERLTLVSLSGEPGFGFLTLSVQLASGVTEDHIVPIGAIRRIALGPADESRRPGFALPKERGPDPAA